MTTVNLLAATFSFQGTIDIALANTSANQLLSNAASSSTLLWLKTLIISNNDGTTGATITIQRYTAASLGGTASSIATVIPVPAGTDLVIINTETSLYFDENTSLSATASVANILTVQGRYDILS